MKVLAMDCSTARSSVAVVDDGEVLFEKVFEAPRGRGGSLFAVVQDALAVALQVDRIAVGIGPGSYNGLRASIALAQGILIARGEKHPVGIVGLLSPLAVEAEDEFVFVGDARGKSLHFTVVTGGNIADGPRLVSQIQWAEMRESLALPVYSSDGLEGTERAFPSAKRMAMLGAVKEESDSLIEPLYLKPPHITIARQQPRH